MLDIVGQTFLGFSIFMERIKSIASKCFFYSLMFIVVINTIIQSQMAQLYDKYMSFVSIGVTIWVLSIIALQIFQTFFKAIHCLILTRDKNTVAVISIHEAGHALITELFFPKANKQTIICNGILGCWDGANYNCVGINLFNEFRLNLYIESNKNIDTQIMEYQLYVFLAGYVAENLHIQSDEMIYKLFGYVCNTTDKQSDFKYINTYVNAISKLTNKRFDVILINAVYMVKTILLQNEYILKEISTLLLRKRKVRGSKISKIVKKYYYISEYSALKTTKWGYFKVTLLTIIRSTVSGFLLIELYESYKNILIEVKKNIHEFVLTIRNDSQLTKKTMFIKTTIIVLLYLIFCIIMVLLSRKVTGMLYGKF